jgi:hypothetical protein
MSDANYRQQMFSLLEAWAQSGQRQKAFCNDRNITYHRFHYWHKRYKDRNRAVAQTGPAFIPLSVLSPAPPAAELIYPDGRRLLFHQNVDAAYLKVLLD